MLHYRKNPKEITRLIKALHLDAEEVKKWIEDNENIERRHTLRRQVIQRSMIKNITLDEFKKIAKRVYQNEEFKASDMWCLNYLRKLKIENLVNVPDRLIAQ